VRLTVCEKYSFHDPPLCCSTTRIVRGAPALALKLIRYVRPALMPMVWKAWTRQSPPPPLAMVVLSAFVPDRPAPVTTEEVALAPTELSAQNVQLVVPVSNSGFLTRFAGAGGGAGAEAPGPYTSISHSEYPYTVPRLVPYIRTYRARAAMARMSTPPSPAVVEYTSVQAAPSFETWMR
jgi:hypothetical protein